MKFSGILTIIKKEFARFFKDRRLVLSLFLPGLLIYCLYSFIGSSMMDSMSVDEDYKYKIACVNAPAFLEQTDLFELTAFTGPEEAQTALENEEIDLVAVFPEAFNPTVTSGQTVTLYFDSVRQESALAYQTVSALLSSLQYDAPKFSIASTDLSTDEDLSGMIFSMIAPMLVMTMLFTGCMSVGPESIAGEKERGTFATMLVTPVKRSHIALGKIIAMSVIALLSGTCSFIGIMLALPKLMGEELTGLGSVSYGLTDYALILGIVLTTVLLMVSLVSVVSALAKSVKEATGYVGPLTLLIVLFGFSTMFTQNATPLGLFFIPLINSSIALSEIFSFAANPTHALIAMAVNLVVTAALSFALTKMFDSEKIVFGK